jgi:hypothetical protein
MCTVAGRGIGLPGFPLKKKGRFLSTKLVLKNTRKFKLSDILIVLILTFCSF